MRKTIQLSEIITEMGNALAAAEWPVKARKAAPNDVKIYDTKEIYKELVYLSFDMQNMESDLHDCVNELCLKCGKYQQEHEGACDGCRWKETRRAFR